MTLPTPVWPGSYATVVGEVSVTPVENTEANTP